MIVTILGALFRCWVLIHRIMRVSHVLTPWLNMGTVTTTSSQALQYSPSITPRGRYAPSPSGDLHVGNLRTALLAWLCARIAGGSFVMRVEDLDRVQAGAAERQFADLKAVGLDWDEEVLYQSSRGEGYKQVIASLQEQGLTYECFCTRKEIQSATSAPHAAPGAYPGTCRDLTQEERERRRQERPPAIRLRAERTQYTVVDELHGTFTGDVDDFVLLRNDGTPAYNLAVVVDDHFQGVTQVVRGDDLLPSAPRQAYLANLLGYEAPRYVHVPLVLNREGKRLAKRDGAVTLGQLHDFGVDPTTGVRRFPRTAQEMLAVFEREMMDLQPWVIDENVLKGA